MKKLNRTTYAVIIIGVLFFIFGFVTWLNGTLIPFLKLACQLKSDTQAFFVTFSFYMAYFFLAIPSSYLLKKTGYKNGMALGLFIMAIGSIIFIPAANARSFASFLTGLFIQGTGLALLQTASNPYISILGPIESAAKRISIMGICNKAAGMLSPLIVGALVLKNATVIEEKIIAATNVSQKEILLSELAKRVITPYIIIAIILAIMAIMIKKSSLPEIASDEKDTIIYKPSLQKASVMQFPHLLLGVLCIFLYVGVEVMAGDAIGTYGKHMGMPLDQTKYFTAFTFIALLGLANALMWPAIFPLAIDGLGKFTKIGSALLIMGIAGGAIIPLLYTSLRDKAHLSNPLSFLICMLPAYVYIFYYAVKGFRIGKPFALVAK